MIGKSKWFLIFTILIWSRVDVDGYQLKLIDNSPVTTGSTVTLNATIFEDNGSCPKGLLTFRYEDDAFPSHKFETKLKGCCAIFNISFETTIGPSSYRYKVDVLEELLPFIFHPIASGRGQLTVTENLNGQLQLFQNGTDISTNSAQTIYVSTNLETVHKVQLTDADFDYLNKSANSVTVYWFVDCVYRANTTGYTFSSNYTQSDSQHEILGIVVANIGPPPVITTTAIPPNITTTTAATSTTTSTTTTAATTTATATATTNATDTTNATVTTNDTAVVVDADVDPPTTSTTTVNSTTESAEIDVDSSRVINSTYTLECQQKKHVDLLLSAVQLENQQKYGYFSRLILVKGPVTNVNTQGKVWIQEGEMLSLQVNCNGSGPFRYCAQYVTGPYNVTGNETCQMERNLVQCQTQVFHYFREPTNYTLVVIIANDVSKVVTPIGINIYKVQKQPQVSVIVVPVTFCSIATIIVVFGIAYFFQNRSRYMVEVADFDFANNSDMECKTFKERLRDAISQAINRTQDYSEYDGSEEQIGGLATPQNQKYGSMQ